MRSGGSDVMAGCFASQPAGGRGRQVSLEFTVKAPPVVAMFCSSTFEVILFKNYFLCLVICSDMEVKGQLVGISWNSLSQMCALGIKLRSTCQQIPLPTEPSQQPTFVTCQSVRITCKTAVSPE